MLTRRSFLRAAALSLLALLPWPRFLRPRPTLAETLSKGAIVVSFGPSKLTAVEWHGKVERIWLARYPVAIWSPPLTIEELDAAEHAVYPHAAASPAARAML